MSERLGKHVARGIVWSGMEAFGGAAVSFAATILLSRLVTPADFGKVAVLQIFMATGLLIVESGFSSALIRLKERTRRHESTVFACNLLVAALLYCIIFVSAPAIARFYSLPHLSTVCRVLALVLPLNALCVVQQARLSASMRFGTLFAATITAAVASSAVAVCMAASGYGVWALVAQQLVMWGVRSVMLWAIQWKQRLLPAIYGDALKQLFGFGWKLLVASLIESVCSNIYTTLIGRLFSVSTAGLFSRAKTLGEFPAVNGTSALQRVTYPAISRLSGSTAKLENPVRKLITVSSWAMIPLMSVLAALAPQTVHLILGGRWSASAPYFALICIGYALYPVHAINLNILNAEGRSDLFLRLEIIKAPISLALLAAGALTCGVQGVCAAFILMSVVCLWINAHYSKRYAACGVARQLKILFPITCCSAAAAFAAYGAGGFFAAPAASLAAGAMAGVSVYLALSKLFMPDTLRLLATVARYFLPEESEIKN